MEKKRLWIVTELFYPNESATAYILTEMAKKFTEVYNVNVICADTNYEGDNKRVSESIADIPGINVLRVDAPELDKNNILKRLVRFLSVSSKLYKKAKKDALYQLRDYFTAFYFQFIKNNYGKDEQYWSNSTDNPTRRTWEGLVFEQICKDHVFAIKQKLGISGILSEESAWFVRANKENGTGGAQIDLLIKRRDRVITICEIKFSNGEYQITKDYDLNLRNKVELFKSETNCKESIQLVMLTTYGVKQNEYSSVIQNQVIMDDLFYR